MLTGKLPFDAAQPMDYLALQIRGTPIPLGQRIPNLQLPDGLEAVVMKTIEKEPGKRHPSAADFAMALKECLQEEVRDDAMRSIPKPNDGPEPRPHSVQAPESRRPHARGMAKRASSLAERPAKLRGPKEQAGARRGSISGRCRSPRWYGRRSALARCWCSAARC